MICLGGLVLGMGTVALPVTGFGPWLTYTGLFTLFSFALIDAGLALAHAIRRCWRDAFVASVLCLLTVGAIELTIADMVRSAFGAPRDAWSR